MRTTTNKNALRFFNRSLKHEKNGNLSSALKDIDAALRLAPDTPLLLFTKAELLLDLDSYEEAVLVFRTLLEAEDCADGWLGLALCYYKLGSFERAAFAFELASRQIQNPSLFTLLASAQIEYDAELALVSAEKALALDPKWDEAISVRKRARELLGKQES